MSAIEYVGSANYLEREMHAKRVVDKAFRDFAEAKRPEWFAEDKGQL